MVGPRGVLALAAAALAVTITPGAVLYLTRHNLWFQACVTLFVTTELALLGVLIFHSVHVGWFDFDWADAHLMGWAAMGVIPLPIGVMIDALGSQPEPRSD